MILTANQAYKKTLEGREALKQEAIAALAEDETLKSIMEWIMNRIDQAGRGGYTSAEFFEKDLKAQFAGKRYRDKWWNTLQKLGYNVEGSCSSNPDNERIFITWGAEDAED